MASRDDCIKAAVRAGAAPQEAMAIVDGLLAEAKILQAEGKAMGLEKELAARVRQAGDEERLRTVLERKQAALTVRRRAEVEKSIAAMMTDGANFGQAMEALMVGSSGRFAGARQSVSARRFGIRGEVYGGIARELDDIPGALDLLRKDQAFGELVHREMLAPDATGDATARKVAAIFSRYMEDMRLRLNDAGANIGRLENYAPQSHAEERLLKAGPERWIDYVYSRLDWERSFPAVTDEAARREILAEVFDNIISGQNRRANAREKGSYRGPRNMARGMAQERVLHFRDAAASLEYHQNFGRGNILQAVAGQLSRYADRLSLMEIFGPNPEIMLQSLIEGQKKRLRLDLPDELRPLARGRDAKKLERLEKELTRARKAGQEVKAARLAGEWEQEMSVLKARLSREADRLWKGHREGKIGIYYAILAGETGSPVNPTMARIASTARVLQSIAKLGGATLSAFADVFIKASNLRYNGENLFSAYKKAFNIRLEAMQSHERKQFGRMLGLYANNMIADLSIRFDAADAPSGFWSRAQNSFFKLSGLEAWTEGHKASYTMTLSNMLGQGARGDFGGVNRHFAATLKRHGLDGRWNLLRKMARREIDGEWHLLPERAYELTDADIDPYLPETLRQEARPNEPERAQIWQRAREREQARVRRDTANSIMGFYADETAYAVLEPDARTRAFMYGNSQAGTARGEMWRFIWQFKSFPVAYTQRFLGEGRWGRAGDAGKLDDVPGMIHAAVSGLTFGYMAMCAKDIAKGRQPRSPEKLETWFAAAMQAGGAGIMGDFFLGVSDRFGNQASGNMLGPGLSAVSDFLPVLGQAVRGEWQGAGEDLLRLGLNNAPGINLWYTRAALDYMLLFHVREMLSPGTLARTERKIREEYNQTYLNINGLDLTPSKHIRRGGGWK